VDGRPAAPSFAWPRQALGPVTAVGVFLLAGNAYYGARALAHAWPLACYPTFRWLAKPEWSTLRVAVVDGAGRQRWLDDKAFERQAAIGKWKNLLGSVMSEKQEGLRRRRLDALLAMHLRDDPSLREAAAIRFYKVTRSTDPDRAATSGATEELVWEATIPRS
jgi:hypothetical protein